jgi:hypothetical protein
LECVICFPRWFNPNWRRTEGLRFKLPNFSTFYYKTSRGDLLFIVVAAAVPAAGAWCTMKPPGRTILVPTRNVLLNLLLQERPGTLVRGPLCRRCLYTLRSIAGVSQKISRLSAARIRRSHVSFCGFWHEETRRRRRATLQTRPFATVREGMLFKRPRNQH